MTKEKAKAFVADLAALTEKPGDGRATLAALRRGINEEPRDVLPVLRVVLHLEPRARGKEQEALTRLACLFALHPTPSGRLASSDGLGAALRRVKGKTGSDSIEQRFMALLQCHETDLLQHLRHAVTLARSQDVHLRWADILQALCWWSSEKQYNQRRWAEEFWGGSSERQDEEQPEKSQ
jgi:CRISPR system Cascade subunit CasB